MEDPNLPLNGPGALSLPGRGRAKLWYHELGRLLYTHNPFYAISASLVFWGLESSFDRDVYSFHSIALIAGLTGYTLILSLTAFVVIRLGRVWDDGRSLLLLVVLMLLATSISFDGALSKYPGNGTFCSLGGLLFSVLVTEGLLRGLAIRLPVLFRLPYYLALALFFVYPVALRWAPFFTDPYGPDIQWALLAFPWLAAIVCLSLLPAVRRGQGYVRDNGTPWPWPWYPWTVFFMIGLGVCGRSFYLCLSMHMLGGFTTIFAPYFLVPFLLAANLLLLEGGLVAGSVMAKRISLLVPVALLLLAMVPPGGKYSLRFLHEILLPATGTGPLFATTLAIATFYVWAIARRVAHAVEALSAVLVILAFVGPETVSATTLCLPPQAYPILGLGAMQALIACRKPSAARWFCAACCAVVGATLEFHETAFTVYHGIIPAHLLLAAALLLGAVFSGAFARWLQYAGAAFLLLGAIAALTGSPALLGDVPPNWLVIYPALVVLVAATYGRLVRNWLCFVSAAATVACWLGIGSVQGYRQLRPAVSGLDYILCGALSLVVGMFISLGKSGVLYRRLSRYREREKQGRPRTDLPDS